MKPITLLASVLMLSAVIGHEKSNFAVDEAETEPPIDDTAIHVRKRESVLCGLTKVILTHDKRHDSRFNDEDSSDYNDDEFLSLDKILGGNYVTYGEIPWQATILYTDQHICGGAIISEFWVIGAAHCFYNRSTDLFTVAVGNHRVYQDDSHEKTYTVARIIRHELHRYCNRMRQSYVWIGCGPQYRRIPTTLYGEPQSQLTVGTKHNNDIALVKIKPTGDGRGIQFNDYVQPICLPDSTDRPPAGSRMLVSGWGKTSADSWRAELLKKTILPVITYADCKAIFPRSLTPNFFCAGYFDGDTDVCKGDSGGPAASKSEGSYVLYGIVSFGNGCPLPNYPVAFVSVPVYRGWIETTIRRNSNGSETDMPVRRVAVA